MNKCTHHSSEDYPKSKVDQRFPTFVVGELCSGLLARSCCKQQDETDSKKDDADGNQAGGLVFPSWAIAIKDAVNETDN